MSKEQLYLLRNLIRAETQRLIVISQGDAQAALKYSDEANYFYIELLNSFNPIDRNAP